MPTIMRSGTSPIQPSQINTFIGIDPGISGGIAVLKSNTLICTTMPATERDILTFLEEHISCSNLSFAVIEEVGGYVGSGGGEKKQGQPGSRMFKFGQSYGTLRMALTALHIPYQTIRPQKWQKQAGVPHRNQGETRTSFKNRLKAKAQQLHPESKITLATSDAILLAHYARYTHRLIHT